MKEKEENKVSIELILGVILMIAFIIMLKTTPREFPLQYIEDGEMKTEVFHSPKEFNERADELKSQGIKYYLDN